MGLCHGPLRTLLDRPEGTPAELIEALGMTQGAASKVITKLEEKGLARREPRAGHTRVQALVLTAAGKSLVPRLAALADANVRHFFGHLDATQPEALIDAMKNLVAHHRIKGPPTA